MMKNRLFFYSSVKSLELFQTQKFYSIDIKILEELNFNVKSTNKISDFLKFWKYDIAFIYFYKYGFIVSLIANLFGKKVYFTGGIDDLDSSYATYKKYTIQKFAFKICYFFSNKCILVSSSDYVNVKKIYNGKIPKKIIKSYHCIELNKFLCPTNHTKENYFSTIVWMGEKENVVRKGVDFSLKVFSFLVSKYTQFENCKFVIIGKKGKGTDYLIETCQELGIIEKVIFTDEIDEDNKINWLKRSRYYMQLSKYEGFGLAAIEALAAQNIVINSGRGGLTDSVGEFGIKVNINDTIEFIANDLNYQIINLKSDFLKLGEKHVIDNFSYNQRKNEFSNILNN